MVRNLAAGVAGIVFGLGLAVSGMTDPAKVLGFLDVAGAWDPSLIFVMGGAVVVAFVAFRFIYGRGRPLLATTFEAALTERLDSRLFGGSALFGVGWGLVGFCPGPGVAALAYGLTEPLIFAAAMIAGAALYNLVPGARAPESPRTAEA
jgi:uncharacterized membrane protein YedE/YeeE